MSPHTPCNIIYGQHILRLESSEWLIEIYQNKARHLRCQGQHEQVVTGLKFVGPP